MITKRGVIEGLSYQFPSGLAFLQISGEMVYVESGCGLRALAACFDAHEGSGDLLEKIQGKEIIYSVDKMNILSGFTPIDEWEGPEIPEEGIEEDEQ